MGRGGGAQVQEITIEEYFSNVVNDNAILIKSIDGNIDTYTFVGDHTISEEYKITLEHNGDDDYSRIVINNNIAIICEGCLHYINSNNSTNNLPYFQMNVGSSFTMTKESSITVDYSATTSSSISIETATFEMQAESKMDFNLVSSNKAISLNGADAQFNFGGSEINFIFDIQSIGNRIALNMSGASTFTMVDDGLDRKINFSIPDTVNFWFSIVQCIYISGANFEQYSGEINYNFNTENITLGDNGGFTGLRVGGTSAINLTKMVFEDFVQPVNKFNMFGIKYAGGTYTVVLKEDGEIIFNKWSKIVEGNTAHVRGLDIGFGQTFENNGTITFNGELDNGAIGIFIEGLNTELVLKENKGRILYNKVGSGAPAGFETIVCSVGDSGKLTLESGTFFGAETTQDVELNTIGLLAQGSTIINNEGTINMLNVTTPYNPALDPPLPGQYQGVGSYLPQPP